MPDETRDLQAVRAWLYLDVNEVKKQLLYIDDVYGSCSNCKKLGLNYVKDKSCPECGTTFKYLATKLKKPGEVIKIASRIKKEGLDLQLIDRDDLERGSAKDAINDLFKS